MKNLFNKLIITHIFLIIIINIAFAQRDTIKYFPFQLKYIIKDSNAKPTGLINDSLYVDTYIDDIDSIFKTYQVVKLIRAYPGYNPPPYQLLDSVYILFCKTDEYELLNTLLYFDSIHNHTVFRYIDRIEKSILDIKDFKKIDTYKNYRIYPNPITDNLTITDLNYGIYWIKILDNTGKTVFDEEYEGIGSLTIDMKFIHKGMYLIYISNKNHVKYYKFLKL